MKNRKHRNLFIIAIVAIISSICYILGSYYYFQVGYPLDDAWIYQTYARNLSHLREWSFIPGSESGGSTGPLWVLIISIGYFFRLEHHVWTYFLGTIILVAIGWIGIIGFELLQPKHKKWALLGGFVLVLEWHLVWASVSGMETLLFAFVILLTLIWILKSSQTDMEWMLIGFLIGVSVWIRPDGITLLGPAGLALAVGNPTQRQNKIKQGLFLIVGFTIPFILYLIFNQVTSGSIWPNTFYAKQAEYAELRDLPLINRLAKQFLAPLPGVGIILLPGFIITFSKAIRNRNWAVLSTIFWFIGYLVIYAIRLPVTYQHGRYVIPAMPIFFLLGISGTTAWIVTHYHDQRMVARVLAKVWMISSISIIWLFWILGVKAYAEDIAIIESEMVTTAHWIRDNTPPNALIAAHDIGALGYFSERNIVDLAGLISPDVIPFIRDEDRLKDYLDAQNVDYLMTFPAWYPSMTLSLPLIFQTHNPYSPKQGGENMAVYQWIQNLE
jgi:hypothetical protein